MDEIDINLREQLTRIDTNQATIQKLFVEQAKLAEETLKFKRERTTSILLAGAGIATAFTALGGLLTKLFWG